MFLMHSFLNHQPLHGDYLSATLTISILITVGKTESFPCLVSEHGEEHEGVDLLLHPQPPDTVPDILQPRPGTFWDRPEL